MKLIEKLDRTEGQEIPRNAVLTYGNSYLSHGTLDGRHFRLILPFPYTAKYICSYTFEEKIGSCYLTFSLVRRNPTPQRKAFTYTFFGAVPIDK